MTIKGYDPEFRTYHLGFPNAEVEAPFHIKKFVLKIHDGQPDAFLNRLKCFFADTPYELVKKRESHYQNVLFILCKLLGIYVRTEHHTSQRCIDMFLQTKDYIYVLEFKLDSTAEQALQQLSDKSYALPFETGETKVFRIGVNLSSETRNIEKWVMG